ncbi:cytochrome P450 [Mycena metata]|uniref:Cytochrome P450 n=1 Tax=Mycena metata TaxID=1033252 RepID=A0AAD7HMR2_9AGAR|nr:cytochrome P450 [Mycena metata]
MLALTSFQILAGSILVAYVSTRYFSRYSRTPLPPGPPGFPFFGNAFNLPKDSPWIAFAELGKKWGDLVSITTFGRTMIIVNAAKIAEDLLEAKGGIFSDRPVIQMGGELVGFRNVLTLCQYGDRVRQERKLFHQLFGTSKAIERFLPLITSEIHHFLRYVMLNPQGAVDGIQRTTGAVVLRIAYGYHLADGQDPFLELFNLRANIFARTTQPTAFLVNVLPILRYRPGWLPGGRSRTMAKEWAKIIQNTVDVPHEYVKNQMASGTADNSFTSTLLQERPEDDHLIKWAASAIQAGGSSTTSSQLEAFFLAMCLYPEVQAEAQRELDRVVGADRLPNISDRRHLPYLNALCKEVLRWHNAVPTGIPHRTREDFIYQRKGAQPVLIPKDSLIIPNIWNMTHDSKNYSDPMRFDPSRFIAAETKHAEEDPARICFGYGRRICPGRLLADTTIFLTCGMVLAVVNVNKIYRDGVAVQPRLGQTTGTVSQTFPFQCVLKPRTALAASLIGELTQ